MVQSLTRARWEELAPRFLDYNYRQTWAYGMRTATQQRASSHHVAVMSGNELVGLADVRVKRLPVIGGGLAYVSGGPLVRLGGPDDAERLARCLRELITEYTHSLGLVLRVQATLGDEQWNRQASSVFKAIGFSAAKTAAPYRTILVNIDRPETEIRASLAQKWRNCLNKSERLKLDVCTGSDDGMLERFAQLFDGFIKRKDFRVKQDAEFYLDVQRHLSGPEKLVVSLAERHGELIAGHVSSMLGDTCVYLLGATSEEGLKANAAYLLQWKTVLAARERGMRRYDLGGIDPETNPGVWHFKQGITGVDTRSAGPFEISGRKFRAMLVCGAEQLYRSMRFGREQHRAKGGII